MDIMELGAIGELVGGVAVIATLAYLAVQVRQGNEIARDNSAKLFNERLFELAGSVAVDRHLAEVWVRGGEGFAELDEVDQQRIILHEWRGIDLFHLAWQQRRRGIMAESVWKKACWNMETLGRRQALREAWNVFRDSYDHEFQAMADPYLGRGA